MSPRSLRAPACATLLALSALAPGCAKGTNALLPRFNQRPTVTLTAAPLGVADTAFYSYDLYWSGNDPDGSIARYDYVVDPPTDPGTDTAWVATTASHQELRFRATEPYWDPVNGWRSNGFHVFAIRAVDDRGLASAVVSRAFYSYTIAPTVRIVQPVPNKLISAVVPSNVYIEWEGHDPDGVGTDRPAKYRYRLFGENDPEFRLTVALADPDSLRAFYAARHFAGWDSVGGDTTFVRYEGLAVGRSYLFVVVAVDEAGAYSPEFSLSTNMLQLTPTSSDTGAPLLRVWCEYFGYETPVGGSSGWLDAALPAGTPVTVRWLATPAPGRTITGYTWYLDDHQPPAGSGTDTECTLGPFGGAEEHFFRLVAWDDQNAGTLVLVHFHTVAITGEHDLLVVDDTRLKPDLRVGGVLQPYGNAPWPTAAELDTFLYARGGFPWPLPGDPASGPGVSTPGVFAGYDFDTLGTRLGLENPSAGVPLTTLARYRHVLWITDPVGANSTNDPTSLLDPVATLRWMSEQGRTNTLVNYIGMGGEVWLAGGAAGYSTLISVNQTANDTKYGPRVPIFSYSLGELAPGGLMYDAAHWRGEFVTHTAFTIPKRMTSTNGGWTSPGWNLGRPVSAPDYSRLPPALRRRSAALGDSLPPTCLGNSARFYSTALPAAVEYLTDDNRITEDLDPDPLAVAQRSALDSLYSLSGGVLITLYSSRLPVAMTYYYGTERPRFLFSGFDLWTWSRQDVVGLVDFVLQDVWGMARTAPVPRTLARPAARPGVAPPAASPRPGPRVPVLTGRAGSR